MKIIYILEPLGGNKMEKEPVLSNLSQSKCPCDPGQFPPGTCIDKFHMDLTAKCLCTSPCPCPVVCNDATGQDCTC